MPKNLISLEDYNKHKSESYNQSLKPVGNGIKCPKCEHELIDSNPDIQLMSFPPQTYVHCSNCNFYGTRIV